MAFRSTEGNGGPPIITSREPVEKPEIARGYTTVLRQYLSPEPVSGGRVTFSVQRDGFAITAHNVEVVTAGYTFVTIDVTPETVVTWDRLPDPVSQI